MKIREKMLKGVQTQVRSKIDFFKHFKLKQIRNPLLYLGPKQRFVFGHKIRKFTLDKTETIHKNFANI